MRVLDVLADATNVIAEGEVLQLMNMHDADLAVEDYLRVIRYKTAKLFEASARLGAVIAGAPRDSRGRLRQLRPRAGHRVPADRRPARLRRRCRPRSARTSATTCAKASRRCRCCSRCRTARPEESRADPPRHRARRGRATRRDRAGRAPHRRDRRDARGRAPRGRPSRATASSTLPRVGSTRPRCWSCASASRSNARPDANNVPPLPAKCRECLAQRNGGSKAIRRILSECRAKRQLPQEAPSEAF